MRESAPFLSIFTANTIKNTVKHAKPSKRRFFQGASY